jgi:3'(2'), 5'-bisphosphate nucleotidase
MTAPLDLAALLAPVCRIAEDAGRDIMAIFHDESRWAVQHKEDDSPLTAADLAAHHAIMAGLAALTPDIPVISEESEAIPLAERRAWSRCWLVDPLDGTKEFISRSREFTVNIALVENGEAILGVVYAPALGLAYAAARGCGAVRIEQGHQKKLSSAHFPQNGSRPLRLVASRRHRGARDAAFSSAMEAAFGPVEFNTAGSAFKICVVAEGEADVYPRFGPTMEWDTAAGQVVVEEAGGALVDEQGRPFRYNQRDSLRNGSFLVIGDAPEKWLGLCARLPAQDE